MDELMEAIQVAINANSVDDVLALITFTNVGIATQYTQERAFRLARYEFLRQNTPSLADKTDLELDEMFTGPILSEDFEKELQQSNDNTNAIA